MKNTFVLKQAINRTDYKQLYANRTDYNIYLVTQVLNLFLFCSFIVKYCKQNLKNNL